MMAMGILKSLMLVSVVACLIPGCAHVADSAIVSNDPLAEAGNPTAASSIKLVDQDLEAPEEYQITDKALWDGRPSLGGVWVAATGVKDPMRVIMRNPSNGKFVIGALFHREADNPGPKLQVSSDAADALGLVAGQPAIIIVTAVRREKVPPSVPDPIDPLLGTSESAGKAPAA